MCVECVLLGQGEQLFCSLSRASAEGGSSQKHLFKPTLQLEEGHCLGEPGRSLEAQMATSVRKVEDRPTGPDYKLPNQCRKERETGEALFLSYLSVSVAPE